MNQWNSEWSQITTKSFAIGESIKNIACSFDGGYIAIEGEKHIYLFDIRSCSIKKLSPSQRNSQTYSKIQFSLDNSLLAVFQIAQLTIYVQIFNLNQRQIMQEFYIDRHYQTTKVKKSTIFEKQFAQRLVISPDNQFIVTSFINDICIDIYDMQKCKHQTIQIASQALHYSLDSKLLYSCESELIIRLFNFRIISRMFITQNDSPLIKNITKNIVAFSSSNYLKIINLQLGRILRQIKVNSLTCLIAQHFEHQLTIHSSDNIVKQWNIANGKLENVQLDSIIYKNVSDGKFALVTEKNSFTIESI